MRSTRRCLGSKLVLFRAGFLLVTFCVAPVLFAQSAPTPATDNAEHTPPSVTATPPTLEQSLPNLPTVTYSDGQLSIFAFNSSLHDILSMVRTETGAAIDIPADATQRVVVRLGPGPARAILDSLLAGSPYNYVMVGSPSDQNVVAKIVLFAKKSSAEKDPKESQVAARPNRTPAVSSRRTEQSDKETSDPDETDNSVAANTAPVTKKVAAQVGEDSEKVANAETADPAADQTTQASAQPRTPNVRTSQEVLQDLYARRRQLQQQQTQSAPQ